MPIFFYICFTHSSPSGAWGYSGSTMDWRAIGVISNGNWLMAWINSIVRLHYNEVTPLGTMGSQLKPSAPYRYVDGFQRCSWLGPMMTIGRDRIVFFLSDRSLYTSDRLRNFHLYKFKLSRVNFISQRPQKSLNVIKDKLNLTCEISI